MSEKLKIIVLKGIPASGKSTWAKDILAKYPGKYKRINKDDLRAMLDDSKWTKDNEKFVLEMRDYLIQKSLEDGYNVILDDTNLAEKHLNKMKEIAKKWNENRKGIHDDTSTNCESVVYCNGRGVIIDFNGIDTSHQKCPGCPKCKPEVEVEEKFFDISLADAIERDKKRIVGHVGEKVIRSMYNQFIAPTKKPVKLEQDSSLPHCIICDVDGTIAEKGDRDIYDTTKVMLDTPNEPIIELVKQLKDKYRIIFFSGRKETARKDTVTWINKYVFGWNKVVEVSQTDQLPSFDLFMRKDDDNRKDSIVKKELFDAHIRNKMFVEFWIDDRRQVYEMVRNEIGLTCLAVSDGDF
jgi:thiol-disulfide isomerase/thioredoxin